MKTYTKKASVLALALCIAAAFAGVALAEDITVNVTPSGTVSGDVYPETWNVSSGNANYGTNYNSSSDTVTFTVWNNGTQPMTTDINITGSTTVWTAIQDWANAAQDKYMMNATFDDSSNVSGATDVHGLSSGGTTFCTGLSPDNTYTFWLEFGMPPSGSTTSQQSETVTMTYSAS